jgi:hypothetical protein
MEQLNDQDIGPILEEIEIRQHPEWKDISDRSPPTSIEELLGPMEIPHCEERHTKASLGIHQQTIKNSCDYSPSEQSERRADRTMW